MNDYRIYLIPEGYVAVSRARPLTFSPPFFTLTECELWAKEREADAHQIAMNRRFLSTIFPETPLTVEESEEIAADLSDDEPPLSPERIAEIVAYATDGSNPRET